LFDLASKYKINIPFEILLRKESFAKLNFNLNYPEALRWQLKIVNKKHFKFNNDLGLQTNLNKIIIIKI
jgi:hypothetical protein